MKKIHYFPFTSIGIEAFKDNKNRIQFTFSSDIDTITIEKDAFTGVTNTRLYMTNELKIALGDRVSENNMIDNAIVYTQLG